MAMNFKCGIRAYREAGTWERLSQLSANFIFYSFIYFHKNSSANTLLTGKMHCLCFSPSAVLPNQTKAGTNAPQAKNVMMTNISFPVVENQKIYEVKIKTATDAILQEKCPLLQRS